jgi:hypothetical protein
MNWDKAAPGVYITLGTFFYIEFFAFLVYEFWYHKRKATKFNGLIGTAFFSIAPYTLLHNPEWRKETLINILAATFANATIICYIIYLYYRSVVVFYGDMARQNISKVSTIAICVMLSVGPLVAIISGSDIAYAIYRFATISASLLLFLLDVFYLMHFLKALKKLASTLGKESSNPDLFIIAKYGQYCSILSILATFLYAASIFLVFPAKIVLFAVVPLCMNSILITVFIMKIKLDERKKISKKSAEKGKSASELKSTRLFKGVAGSGIGTSATGLK